MATFSSIILHSFYNGKGSFAASATSLPTINLVHSMLVFSKSFNLPDASSITPAQATFINVNADNEIAVDSFKCLANDSSIVGDLELAGLFAVPSPSIEFLHIRRSKLESNPFQCALDFRLCGFGSREYEFEHFEISFNGAGCGVFLKYSF